MLYGLTEDQVKSIQQVFSAYANVKEAILFGSRAKGNYRPGSDIDLALKGNDLTFTDILSLQDLLDDINLPYTFDLLIYDEIKDKEVTAHIDRVGVSFFRR